MVNNDDKPADNYRRLVDRAAKMASILENGGASRAAEVADRWHRELEQSWQRLFTADERSGKDPTAPGKRHSH